MAKFTVQRFTRNNKSIYYRIMDNDRDIVVAESFNINTLPIKLKKLRIRNYDEKIIIRD